MDVNMENFKKVNMPTNLNYDLGVPAEKGMAELISYDPLLKIFMKVQQLTLTESIDTDVVQKEKGRLV